jgi:pyruvate carboxylase subunit B
MGRKKIYRAFVGDREIDIMLDGDVITIDDEPAEVSFHPVSESSYVLILNGRSHEVFIEESDPGHLIVTGDGSSHRIQVKDERDLLLDRFGLADAAQHVQKEIRAPMPGLVLDVLVVEGRQVEAGEGLLVLEAMKMVNVIRAAAGGTVARIHVKAGDAVGKNDILVEFGA